MVNLKYITFGIIFFISLVIGYLFYNLNNIEKEKVLINNLENALLITNNLLEEEKKQALSFAILLKNDKEFLESFMKNDREQTFKIIQNKLAQLELVQPKKFRIQVHDKDLHTYVKSWDSKHNNENLEKFRRGLVEIKQTKKHLVSIELGKRLNIKAIVPIIENGIFLGSIEVITEFETISNILKQRGYQFFVLLDDKYLDIAVDLAHNIKLKNYVICNKVEDISLLNALENIDIKNLGEFGYLINTQVAIGYFQIYDIEKRKLGFMVVAINPTSPIHLDKRGEK
ncbi:MAG: cache domain-containing protein [Arcobacteraceae bacterium]|jgi:hypothetical protein|nr:cache domain-containing protein [Arcobacteraceae bacterium]